MDDICGIWDKYYGHVMRKTTVNESYGRVFAATALTILHVLTHGRDEGQEGVYPGSADSTEMPGSFPDPGSMW